MTEINELPAADALDGTELLPADQGAATVKVTTAAIAALAGGGAVDSVFSRTGDVTAEAIDYEDHYDPLGAATAAQAAAEASAAAGDVTVAAGAAAALGSHAADTTAVHGISDTANLVYTDDARLSDQRVPTDGSVVTAKIGDAQVTAAKVATDVATQAELDNATAAEVTARDAAIAAAIAALLNSAPGALDTLDELAAALGDDPNFATTITNALAGKQPLDAANLSAIAALTTTLYGRSLLEAANAAALRTLAELGTAATASTGDFDAAGAATSAVSTHAAAGDPHTGYRLESVALVNADIDAAAAIAQSKIASLTSDLATKAPLASPTFTGTPTVPADAYDATSWNGSLGIPSKDAVRDKIESLGAGSGADVQVFTVSGTWNKPSGKTNTRIVCFGGGGGGGGGRQGAATESRCGGGGGGGAGYSMTEWRTADLPGSLAVTVGAAGTGGAAATTGSANGGSGTAGGASYVGAAVSTSYGHGSGGSGGSGGFLSSGAGGAGGTNTTSLHAGVAGAAASTTGGAGVTPSTGAATYCVGGAAGGGITSADVAGAGATSRLPLPMGHGTDAATWPGGAAGTAVAGASATRVGQGGSSGGGSITAGVNGGAGGAGLYGGGGGGGGAGLNSTTNSGAGGNGGGGLVIIVSW